MILKPVFKVIVAGGRNFNDFSLLYKKLDYLLKEKIKTHRIIIVSGGAKGADTLGEIYAKQKEYSVDRYPVKWIWENNKCINKNEGYKRNVIMAENADALIAFWDGKSRGTSHMIQIAKSKKLPYRVYNYKGEYYGKL